MIPLRRKLVSTSLFILSLAVVALGGTAYHSLTRLTHKFSDLNIERSQFVKSTYQRISSENIQKIVSIYTGNLKTKGLRMLSKDSGSLTPMIADNAFMSVQNFLLRVFENDKDIRLATYFSVDQGNIIAWYYITPEYKNDLSYPITYDFQKKGWVGQTKKGRPVFLSDPALPEILKMEDEQIIVRNPQGTKDSVSSESSFDFIIPFVDGKSGSAVRKAKKAKESIGFLRYILSPNEMNREVEAEKKALQERLTLLELENRVALDKTQEIGAAARINVLELLFLSSVIILIAGYIASLWSAIRISNPLVLLTHFAERIKQGHYSEKVDVTRNKIASNDEIGILAQTFVEMSQSIQKRDADLAQVNHSLEETVEIRTLQLKDEVKRISDLLNSMRQAVFSVSSNYQVVAPVSKYSENVFKTKIEGRSVFDFLYHELSSQRELYSNLESTLLTVFGENEIQWSLLEDFLPERVELTRPGQENQVLRISYQPLYDSRHLLHQILFVVEDITEVESLERKIRDQKTQTDLLEEMTRNDPSTVRTFFSNTGTLLNEIFQLIRGSKELSQEKSRLILRHLHTLKGNSRILDFQRLAKQVHEVEEEVLASSTNAHAVQLRASLSKILDLFDEYYKIASPLYGISNELKDRTLLDLQKTFIEVGWSENPQVPLSQALVLSEEIGDAQLATQIQRLLSSLEAGDPPAIYAQEVNAAMNPVLKKSLGAPFFTQHPTAVTPWIGIGWRLWNISETIHSSELLEILKEAKTYAEDHCLFFYCRYFSELSHLVESDQNLASRSAIERHLWTQYLMTAKAHFAFQFPSSHRKDWSELLQSLVQDSKDAASRAFPMTPSSTWLLDLLPSLNRHGIEIPQFFARWAEKTGLEKNSLVPFITENDSTWIRSAEILFLDLINGGCTQSIRKTLFPQLPELNLLRNIFLESFDLCQVFCGVIDRIEFIKFRHQYITILRNNIRRLKDFALDPPLSKSVETLHYLPLKPVLWTLKKMSDSISSNQGKKVSFSVRGDDVSVDPYSLHLLMDSIVHLLRNSLDHGIEFPDERIQTLKPEIGQIEISCHAQGQSIVIQFSDDGRGISRERILATAIKKGLIRESEGSALSKKEVLNLIFRDSFTTKDQTSEISGRGIGMNIIQENIESLEGKISVVSDLGQGAVFEIQIPDVQRGTPVCD